jgi:hypothetical protein
MSELINWLLEGPSWIEYRTRIDLMNQSENDPEVLLARRKLLEDRKINELISEESNWPGPALKGHKDPSHPIHKLAFLSDIGLRKRDPRVNSIVDNILKRESEEGVFEVFINIPKHFGGSGEGIWTWMLCDTPLILYSLIELGLSKDKRVLKAIDYLAGLISDNGWKCTVSPKIKFRGPGKKDDPCPYATLLMLKLLSKSDDLVESRESRIGAESILNLWEQSRERHPYLFYMGTDFRKLKAPLVWYDILHTLDVLTRFPFLKKDKRLEDMINIVKVKADDVGRFTPESIYTKLKGWEFSQKKEPSRWITFLVERILKRHQS